MPIDWECAVYFNSFDCGGTGAKWCIGDKNNYKHWNSYVSKNNVFYYVFFIKQNFFYGKKLIFQFNTTSRKFLLWDSNNNLYNMDTSFCKEYDLIKHDALSLLQENLPKTADLDYFFCQILKFKKNYNTSFELMDLIQNFFEFTKDKYKTFSKEQFENIQNMLTQIHKKFMEEII